MARLTGIKAVSFDVDGTLWDFEQSMRESLRRTLEQLQEADPEAAARLDVDKIIEVRDRVHDELRGRVTDLATVRRESFRAMLRDSGRPDDALASHLGDVYFRHRDLTSKPYDDVLPTLMALRGGYALGIISNGNMYPAGLGLEGFVDFAVFAQDHGGIEKPDPRMFRIALKEAGCTPHELVHVGDSLENDVAGAAGAAVRSIWLNRNGESRTGVRPDVEISSLRELAEML
jgi:putative hydrolase of the HAD superfamily